LKPKSFIPNSTFEQFKFPRDWVTVSFKEILTRNIRHGLYKPSKNYGSGVKIVKMGIHYKNRLIGKQEMPLIEVTDKELERFGAKKDELLFSRTSMMSEGAGKCTLIMVDEPLVFESNIICATINEEKCYSLFYFFFFNSEIGRLLINTIVQGTQSRSIKSSDLMELLIPVPPKDAQKKISAHLLEIENLIEILQRKNFILEKIIQLFFRSRFLDFDEQKEFIDSELGKIPKGWQVKKISDFCNVRRGASPRPVGDPLYFGGDIPWIKISDITDLKSPFLFSTKETVTEEGTKKSVLLPSGSLIISNSGTVGLSVFLAMDGCIHDGWLYFENLKIISKEFLYFQIYFMREHLINIADGTVQKNLNTTIMGSQKIVCPPSSLIKSFTQTSSLFLESIKQNEIRINHLIKIQDYLLSKFMLGEIKI